MKILIDNGHSNRSGNSSPDKKIYEWKWAREIARSIVKCLTCKGYDAELLTPEDGDVSISTRVSRANAWCKKLGAKNVVLVSIHNNASGSGMAWYAAHGWSVFCSKNASERSKRLARIMTDNAIARKMMGDRSIPKEKFWTWSWRKDDIGILANSNCPAVLTENFFMDNREDVAYLLSDEGKNAIVKLHCDSIVEYIIKSVEA